jgi:hypothetical protein
VTKVTVSVAGDSPFRAILRGLVESALIAGAFWAGTVVGPIALTAGHGPIIAHAQIVTAAQVKAQEPPTAPGLIHRATYKDVNPTHVQVAPGAGAELLAAMCDTARQGPGGLRPSGDSSSSPAGPPASTPNAVVAPSLAYAWELSQPWTPFGAVTVRQFTVSRDGEAIIDSKAHLPAEGRLSPAFVVREARIWRRLPKPLLYTGAVFAAGWFAHGVASQF